MMPRATVRLQFHKGFAFADAERHIPYLARLGVSHVYASPITTARPGSMHGYDVIDPTRVNPELGGEDALRRLTAALRASGLGLIVDIVPNHMAVSADNAWWSDVLRYGRASRYAAYFDIDWGTEDEALRGKVLLPVLGKPLHDALRDGEITLAHEGDGYVIRYFQHRFPVATDVADVHAPLDALLARQHYRLAWWRVANDEINWRRFFDINELAGLRMEHPAAFEDVHALIFRLYAESVIDGVRIDHIDGLADPARYCRTLRQRLESQTERRPPAAPRGRPYVIVEKILLRGETLPSDWNCDGTTGYDFMNDVSAVQHDPAGAATLGALWASVSGRSADFESEERAARREIIARSFSAQLEACAAAFQRVSRAAGGELSRASLRRSVIELLAHFPVYRTYAAGRERPAADRPMLDAAMDGARAACLSTDRSSLDQLQAWLTTADNESAAGAPLERAVTAFQQLSAPVAAKAVEDTAFYRYARLLSRNDVGFEAARLGMSADDFHAAVRRRHAGFPHAMLATATHDHKRGEDVRARLAVLSERADDWSRALPHWIERCRPLRRAVGDNLHPGPGDIAILLQMIVGAWPLDLDIADARGRDVFAQRLAQWQQKALREAKLATDWSVPNETYEDAAQELLAALVTRNEAPDLLREVVSFAQAIAPAGAVNGLAQALLKLTVPGVPDIYQGTELWDFSLVDPDNRRPVDFAAREQSLGAASIRDAAAQWRDGRIKQALIARVLAVRRARPQLFAQGDYQPLELRGAFADHVIAFARRAARDGMIVVVPRAASHLLRQGHIRFEPGAWRDTALISSDPDVSIDAVSGRDLRTRSKEIALGSLFDELPFAILLSSPLFEALS